MRVAGKVKLNSVTAERPKSMPFVSGFIREGKVYMLL